MTRELKITPKNGAPDPSVQAMAASVSLAAWIADCRQALRNITCGAKTQRDMLIAQHSMSKSVSAGGDFLTLYRSMSGKKKALPDDIMAEIDARVTASDAIRDVLAVWVSRDKSTGPCAAENSACARIPRLQYLAKLGIVPVQAV